MAEPLPLCYLNGAYLPLREARISPLDRGFLYADGVYEVMPVYERAAVSLRRTPGAARRAASRGISMEDPHTPAEWRAILGGLIERNGGGDQYVYWQVTRGAEHGRNHAPLPRHRAHRVRLLRAAAAEPAERAGKGCRVRDGRRTRAGRAATSSRSRCSPTCCCAQLAVDAAAAETILLREGELMEASASAVHVVLGGEVLMPPNSRRILPGTTRSAVEEMAARAASAAASCR